MAKAPAGGKWAALKNTLKPLPAEIRFADDAAFAEKVEVAKQALLDKTLPELAEIYNDLCPDDDAIKAAQTDVNALFEALDLVMIPLMEDQGISSFKLKTGENFILSDKPCPTVVDKAAVRQWFINQGMSEILNPHPSTLAAIVKGILENPIDPVTQQPKPLPTGIDVYRKPAIQRRKK